MGEDRYALAARVLQLGKPYVHGGEIGVRLGSVAVVRDGDDGIALRRKGCWSAYLFDRFYWWRKEGLALVGPFNRRITEIAQ